MVVRNINRWLESLDQADFYSIHTKTFQSYATDMASKYSSAPHILFLQLDI